MFNEKNVDYVLGRKLKLIRKFRHLTLTELATQIGISMQQLKKYEDGINRISASKLLRISTVLKISILYFYEDDWLSQMMYTSNQVFSSKHGVNNLAV